MSDTPTPIEVSEVAEGTAPAISASKHRVKINDQELEVDTDELIKGYQRVRSADQRYQEAARLRKEASEIEAAFSSGDFKAISQRLNIPQTRIREMSENYLIELLKFDALSEPEKRALIAEKERDEIKSERDADKAKREDEDAARVADQAAEFIDSAIADALTATGKKTTAYNIARIATFLHASLSKDATIINEGSVREAAGKAVKLAYKSLDDDVRGRVGDMTVDELKAILPKKTLDELRRASVDEVLSQDPVWAKKPKVNGEAKLQTKRKLTTDEWFAEKEKLFLQK